MMNEHSYNNKHLRNLEQVTKQVQRSYKDAINQIAELAKNTTLDKSGEFYFAHHKTLSKKVDGILENLFTEVSSTIVTGVNSSWQIAVDKNNEICHYLYGKGIKDLPDDYKAKYLSNNDEARQSFINRKEAGQLNWSERVWNLKGQFKQELELALESNLGKGNSAQFIAKEIKTYLNKPDKLFRRVRNEKGELRLSKNAKAYHPGQGSYRSSYRNALRLARNEINFSYEKSNHEKRQQQDFVVGVEIKVSKNHNPASDKGGISCLSLQGMYPKDFDFTYKWHVNCLCQSFAILKTKEEVNDDLDKILAGQEPDGESVNKVTGLPNSFSGWVDKNKDMWKGWKNEPRFLTYNQGLLNNLEKVIENKLSELPRGAIFEDAKRIDSIFKKAIHGYSEVLETFEKNKENGIFKVIRVDDIRITQPNIQSKKVVRMASDIEKTPIINVVEFEDGEMAIFDGHHRLTTVWALNKKKVKVFLVKQPVKKRI